METNIEKVRENKRLIVMLVLMFVVFAILFVILTRDVVEEVVEDERTPEEILIEEQTEELRILMEDFKPLTEEETKIQTQELENLFERMR